jgi:DNA primase
MTRLFSAQELYSVRNDIPISGLIENVLNIPARTTEGVFRFLCPVCGEFNTAVHSKTNLARCFCCKKNFNSIDLVMIVKKETFVKAVRFLKTRAKTCHVCKKPEHRSQSPQHIADIVKSIMPAKPGPDHLESIESISNRVLCIEKKLEQMMHQMEIIVKTIT